VLSKVNVTLTWLRWPHYQLHSSPTQTVKHHHLHILQTRCRPINETLSQAYTAIIIMLMCFYLQYLVANLQHTTMNITFTHASPKSSLQCKRRDPQDVGVTSRRRGSDSGAHVHLHTAIMNYSFNSTTHNNNNCRQLLRPLAFGGTARLATME
jgi:short subunit fatty acids transporter